ncbi:MAG: hypothetical protein ABIQ73_23915 [Acidimicrobiales bacterium]
MFPTYPGSTLLDERSYEIKAGDSGGTGHYTVVMQYRLPRDATSHDVFEYFKNHVPPGWRSATDDDCVAPALPPNRSAQLPSGPWVLTSTRIIATFFAPEPGDGVTISLRGSGDNKLLFLDQETLSCGPPGPNPLDRLADDFDR